MTTSLGPALSIERPFAGLRPFGFFDHEFFFGREDQVYSLYRLLDRSRFVAVVGSSGSGKSSLVSAGLLPLLDEESKSRGARRWRYIQFRPGYAPLRRLADELVNLSPVTDDRESRTNYEIRRERIGAALAQSSLGFSEAINEIDTLRDHSLLVVVDQFEELFRYSNLNFDEIRDLGDEARWREEAAHFVQLLLEAVRAPASGARVLITMRSDFIGDCARFHGLPEAVSATQFLVPSLTRDELEEVIRKPIERAGATIEPALVERLLNDSNDEPDQLPVLQHCLLRLWECTARSLAKLPEGIEAMPESRRHISTEHYRMIKGIAGALSQHADEILTGLRGHEIAVEQLFRALSEIDKDRRAVRRALSFGQLVAETGIAKETLRQVVDRFRADDCSFLVPSPSAEPVLADKSRIDVGHEALLRRWEKVSGERGTSFAGDPRKPREGWIQTEENDGRRYQGLASLAGAGGAARGMWLPLDQAELHSDWWTSRPRTAAWAQRYGGGYREVQQLLQNSLAALRADRDRRAAVDYEISNAYKQRRRRMLASATAALAMLFLFAAFGIWQWTLRLEQERIVRGQREQAEKALQALSQLRSQGQLTAPQQAWVDAIEAELAKLRDSPN